MANQLPDQNNAAVLRADQEEAEQAKILVVDDRPENLLVTRTMLDELGHQIITVRSGDEALKYLLEHDVAVILLDVNMPAWTAWRPRRTSGCGRKQRIRRLFF
jgi:CheY-like chemotaxis protein